MSICRTIALVLLLIFALTPCRADLSKSLRLRPSFVLKMTPDDWQSYCEERGGWRRDALPYYLECTRKENKRRLRRFPRATQRRWRLAAQEINRWFDVYFDWYLTASDAGTERVAVGQHEEIYREQCLRHVLRGYARPQQSRSHARRCLEDSLWTADHEATHPGYNYQSLPAEKREETLAAVAAFRRANRRLRRFALSKSPNTMRAIANGVEKMMSDEAW